MRSMEVVPKLGVIVVTYNSGEHITGCLESLASELRGIDHTIAVVDNASRDETWKLLTEFPKGKALQLVIHANETNRGFGSAVNFGVELVGDCNFYLIVNPDLCLHAGAISEMISYMKMYPNCGIVGPTIEDETGSLIPSSFGFPSLAAEILKLSGVAKYVPPTLRRLISRIAKGKTGGVVGAYLSAYQEMSAPKSVDWASGACLMVRREAAGMDALFDDRFFLYYEDTDLCRRVRDAGYSVDLLPPARAMHYCHGSTGGEANAFCLRQDIRSMFLYRAKHNSRLSALLLASAGTIAGLVQILATPMSLLFGKRKIGVLSRLSACSYLLRASLSAFKVSGASMQMPKVSPNNHKSGANALRISYAEDAPSVSVIIPVRNETAHVRTCLEHICSQDYPNITEVILIDGMSTDGTRDIIEEFCARDNRIKMVDNPMLEVAAALNTGFAASQGDIVVRADTHALYAHDYVSQCVARLKATGAGNVGGSAVPVEGTRYWERAIVLAHISHFGMGGASFRQQGNRGTVDTVWPGAFPRTVLQQVGKLDEHLNRTEDIDLNARIRKLGYFIYQSPTIRVRYVPRRGLRDLAIQSFTNGRGVIETLAINRSAVRLRHLVPGIFVFAVAASAIGACLWSQTGLLLGGILASYLTASIWFSCCAGLERGAVYIPAMPVVFGALHFSYGLGSLAGLLSLVRYWKKGGASRWHTASC